MEAPPTSELKSRSTHKLIPERLKSLASAYLEDPEAQAFTVYEAAKLLLGDDIREWEGETLQLELERLGIKYAVINVEKILCASALAKPETVITDQVAFKNMALVLNSHHPHHSIDEVIPAHDLCWAVMAIHAFSKTSIYFDYEPLVYLSRILHDEGFMLAPAGLKFVQPMLTRLNHNTDLEEKIKSKTDDPIVRSQLDKLAGVEAYVAHMYAETESTLQKLRGD